MNNKSARIGVKASILCVISASPERVEARIVMAAADAICDEHEVEIVRVDERPLSVLSRLWRKARNCEILMVHSPFLLSIPAIVIGRLLRRKIIGFLWDDYPVLISGRRYNNSVQRRFLDRLENWAIDHIDLLLVPSPDFRSMAKYQHAVFLPFWCRSSITLPPQQVHVDETKIRLLFAGQINRTRGIKNTLALLDVLTEGDYVLCIAAPEYPEPSILEHPNVEYLGHLTQNELAIVAQQCDAGIISLHPNFDGVGFPSKTFDYLSWNLPLLFAGRSYPWMTGLAEDIGIGLDANKLNTLSRCILEGLRTDFACKRDRFERSTCLEGTALKSLIEKV